MTIFLVINILSAGPSIRLRSLFTYYTEIYTFNTHEQASLKLETTREESGPNVFGINACLDSLHLLDVGLAVRGNDLLTGHGITHVLEFVVRADGSRLFLDVGKVAVDVGVKLSVIGGLLPLERMSVDYRKRLAKRAV